MAPQATADHPHTTAGPQPLRPSGPANSLLTPAPAGGLLTAKVSSPIGEAVTTVDLDDLKAPTVLRRQSAAAIHRRTLLDLRRRQSAAEAISGLTRDVEIYGFTKGQFSLLDLLTAAIDVTGPAAIVLSTWTAARTEIQALRQLRDEGKMTSLRWLVDVTFARRDPAAAPAIRETFGLDAIRVAQNHSKFALFTAPNWQLVLRTSMNLNMNPRFEDFTLGHDPALYQFLAAIIQEIWTKQKRELAQT
jgi:hypothetical protein